MKLILLAILAASATTGDAHPLALAERAVIVRAIASFFPTRPTIATDPVKPDAVVVCGRANGRTFKVAIHRNVAGQIVRADEAYVSSPSDNANLRMNLMGMCMDNGYMTL